MWHFYRKQPTLSFKRAGHRDGLLLLKPEGCSSSDLQCEGWTGRPIGGAWSPPLALSPLPVPPCQSLCPSGSPSMHSWVLGLGRVAAQPLMPLSFTHSLFLLGVFFGICLPNKLSMRGVLTQASYYQSQGAKVGKPTKSIGGNDFRANLENKHTPCWAVWGSSCWFRGLKTWYCGSGIWVLKSLWFAWLLPWCVTFSNVDPFSCWKVQAFIPTAHVRTHKPCDSFIFQVYCCALLNWVLVIKDKR